MKTSYIILLLSMLLYGLASAQIPNASFEIWYQSSNNDFDWKDVYGWATQNYQNIEDGYSESAVRIADAVDGNSALRLTNTPNDYDYPAFANSYTYIDGIGFRNKFPISDKPVSLHCFYKYSYPSTDFWGIGIKIYHENQIIGSTTYTSSLQVSEYTSLSIPINYTSLLTPDSASILILAGSSPFVEGSQLTIDNLSFSTSTGIDDIHAEINASLYPNPSQGKISLEFEQSEKGTTSIKVIDILGNTLKEFENVYSPGKHNVDLETTSLKSGVYLVHILQNNNSKIMKLFIEQE